MSGFCLQSVEGCKHVAYYSPPNVHIYSLLAEQLCCSVNVSSLDSLAP